MIGNEKKISANVELDLQWCMSDDICVIRMLRKENVMIFFITFLRALAACFITNAHYTGIYPTDIIANGGLIGDVLFFAISGYCLFNVKNELSLRGFACWYGKRIWRVYPPVMIVTAIFMLFGAYDPFEHSFFWWYIYPTYYHFVASIIILYIPFFFIMKIDYLKKRIPLIMMVIAVTWLLVYFVLYDRSYYHIDTVWEPMIRFLFMECMLLGAWFRQNDKKLRNKFKPGYAVLTLLIFLLYFVTKLLLSSNAGLVSFQFLNQIIIFILLWFMFRSFCGLDEKLELMPSWSKTIVQFIANMTLEIYVVQYVLITVIREWRLFFPLNWILLTASIIISAYILHMICNLFYSFSNLLLKLRKTK